MMLAEIVSVANAIAIGALVFRAGRVVERVDVLTREVTVLRDHVRSLLVRHGGK